MASTCSVQMTAIKTVMQLFMLTLSCFISISDCKNVTRLSGYFGGEVAFHCPIDEHRKMKFLYLQKGTTKDDFVNGYYGTKDMQKYKPWLNSRVDRQHNIFYLSGLNISHSGVYTCVFGYEYSSSLMEEQDIELTVTANYSEPLVHPANCTDKHSECSVRCSSHGGYPKAELRWQIHGVDESPRAGTWSKEVSDNDTQLFNLSSVETFNCSTGKQQNISCSVLGMVTSFSICTKESASPEPTHVNLAAIISPIVIVLIVLIVIMALVWNYWKKICPDGCRAVEGESQREAQDRRSTSCNGVI